MKIILLQDVKDLGKKDQILEVSDGYARNFLLPRKVALEANATNLNEVRNRKISQDNKKQKEIDEANGIVAALKDKTITLFAKAGESGKLFGAISNSDVAEKIKSEYKLEIDKKKIVLKEQIKSLGTYTADIKLYQGISVQVNVDVKSEK